MRKQREKTEEEITEILERLARGRDHLYVGDDSPPLGVFAVGLRAGEARPADERWGSSAKRGAHTAGIGRTGSG